MVGTTWDKILQGRWIALLWASSVGLNIWKSFDGQRATVMGIPCWDPSQRDYLECQELRLSVSSVYLSTPHVYFVDLEWFGSICVHLCHGPMDVSYPDDVWMPYAVLCCALVRGSVDLGLSQGLQAATEASSGVGGSGWIGRGLPRFALRPDENPTQNTYRTMSHDIASYHTGHTAIPEQSLCSWLGICDVICLCLPCRSSSNRSVSKFLLPGVSLYTWHMRRASKKWLWTQTL